MATARTPEDENIKTRLRKPQPSSEAGIASITLLSRDNSKDKEELEIFET
jgi:hypothetical protein